MESAVGRGRSVLVHRFIGAALALLCFEIVLRLLAYGVSMLDPRRGRVYRSITVRHLRSEGHWVSHWDSTGTA